MGLFSAEKIFGIKIRESANDGSDFTNPDADYRMLYLGEDGLLHVKDAAGTVTDPFTASGSVATDAIYDAKGDLPVGTGANTAAKLTVGANGTRPVAASGETTGMKWSFPPAYEHVHTIKTTGTSVTSTNSASPDTIITAGSGVAFDGTRKAVIEFFCPQVNADNGAAGRNVEVQLWDDTGGGATAVGRLGTVYAPSTSIDIRPMFVRYVYAPSNATHTYSIRAYVNAGTATFNGAGGGSATTLLPVYIRVLEA